MCGGGFFWGSGVQKGVSYLVMWWFLAAVLQAQVEGGWWRGLATVAGKAAGRHKGTAGGWGGCGQLERLQVTGEVVGQRKGLAGDPQGCWVARKAAGQCEGAAGDR